MTPRLRLLFQLTILGAVLGLCAACGASQREKALSTALSAVEGSRDAFVIWDDAHQREIVATSSTDAEVEERLTSYRKQREAVLTAFELAYQGIAQAALSKTEASLRTALSRVDQLYEALRALMSAR